MTLSEHNENFIFKKGSTTLVKATMSGKKKRPAYPLRNFCCSCASNSWEVIVHLPFRRFSCVYLLLFANTFHKVLIIFVIFLLWIVSFVERKKEGYRVWCMWKKLLQTDITLPGLTVCMLITPIKLWFRANAAAKYIKGHQWNPVLYHLGWKHRLSLYLDDMQTQGYQLMTKPFNIVFSFWKMRIISRMHERVHKYHQWSQKHL